MQKWLSPGKLNLFLYVIGYNNSNNYHFLQTLLQFINYYDVIYIKTTNNNSIHLLNSITGITKQNNMIIKAAKLLQNHCSTLNFDGKKFGAKILIKKVLPISGGLGGGSSNAATVLVALNYQWQCGLNMKDLISLASTLGADVPFFIYGRSAFAEGIGNQLTYASPVEKWYIIGVPPVKISTSTVFNNLKLKKYTKKSSFKDLIKTPFRNDLEQIIRSNFPIIDQYISWLSKYAPSRLTGTGSCVFAEFDNEISARNTLLQSPSWIKAFIAKGVNISPMYSFLKLK